MSFPLFALVVTFAVIGGLLCLNRAAELHSGRWALAGFALLAAGYSLDILLARLT